MYKNWYRQQKLTFKTWIEDQNAGSVALATFFINNSITSSYFTLSRGVRQGDPLSGYLFILVIETLAQKIRVDKEVTGITIGHKAVKLTQYVDDLTIMVKNAISAEKVFYIFDKFENVSGLKINREKTEGMWLGRNKNVQNEPFHIKWPKRPVKGIYFSYDSNAALKLKN